MSAPNRAYIERMVALFEERSRDPKHGNPAFHEAMADWYRKQLK